MLKDICFRDASELAILIRLKEISPVEVVRAHLERIDSVNPKINAIVTMIPGAVDMAREAEGAVMRGDNLGPLHGVPFTIKDCFDTRGIRTTRGSKLFADYIPPSDATAVERLKAAGAIPLGKTNLPEFAFWWETDNRLFGRTLNPWNPERTTGGSSGGEAAAIAAGLSPLGLGSDVGGSIRMPAHYCSVVGLKPTHGRIPLTGHFPETLLRFMHVGPLARSVADAALALKLMAGPDGKDWYALPGNPLEETRPDAGVKGLRLGWMAEEGFGRVDAQVVATVARAATTLKDLGCGVEPVSIPGLVGRDWNALSAALFSAEAGLYLDPLIAGRHSDLSPIMRERLSKRTQSLQDYLTAADAVEGLRRDLAEYFMRYDILLCPVSPVPAHPHNATELVIGGNLFPARHVVRTTAPFSLSGSPALSVPFGRNSEDLPIGVQLVGRHFDEPSVFCAGMALEKAAGLGKRRPTL
jgi:aspartyl-tRNA(Asn)/glutamyl-tRNA(Gln) amidotransferase subunit A